jgi:hypothetical protein
MELKLRPYDRRPELKLHYDFDRNVPRYAHALVAALPFPPREGAGG